MGQDYVWTAESGEVRHTLAPRDVLTMDEFLKSPFRHLLAGNERFVRYWLAQAPEADEYPLLKRLKADGYDQDIYFLL